MTSPDTPKPVSNLTMPPRKPKPSAIAEASEPEIVGLHKRVIPAKAAQAAAAALTEAGFSVASAITASAGAPPAAEPTPSPLSSADAGADQ